MKIYWHKDFKSWEEMEDHYLSEIEKVNVTINDMSSVEEKHSYLQNILFEYERKVLIDKTIVSNEEAEGKDTMEHDFIQYIKLCISQLEKINPKPINNIDERVRSKGRYKALVRYCNDDPITKDKDATQYGYYRDWVRILEKEDYLVIKEKTIKKFRDALPLELKKKLSDKLKSLKG